jgi:hypothetical protein
MSTVVSGTLAPSPAVTALPMGLRQSPASFLPPPSVEGLRFERLRPRTQTEKTPSVSETRSGECPTPYTLHPTPSPEGLPLAKRETLRRYGPNVLPLFYTARRAAPEQLEWEPLAQGLPCRLTFGLTEEDGEIAPLLTADTEPDVCTYTLPERALEPGLLYAWRVEPQDAPEVAPAQQGRFWILDAAQRARCLQGCRAIAEGGDRDFVTLGLALFLAELELYQDALELIKRGPARAKRDSRVLLAHTAQALIYRQMGKNLTEVYERSDKNVRPPAEFLAWAASREKYHADRASAQMEAAQTCSETPGRSELDHKTPRVLKAAA